MTAGGRVRREAVRHTHVSQRRGAVLHASSLRLPRHGRHPRLDRIEVPHSPPSRPSQHQRRTMCVTLRWSDAERPDRTVLERLTRRYGEDSLLSRVPTWWDFPSPQSRSAEFLAVYCCGYRQRRRDQRPRRCRAAGPYGTGADSVSDAPRSASAAGAGSVEHSSCLPSLGPHPAITGPHVVALPPKRRFG